MSAAAFRRRCAEPNDRAWVQNAAQSGRLRMGTELEPPDRGAVPFALCRRATAAGRSCCIRRRSAAGALGGRPRLAAGAQMGAVAQVDRSRRFAPPIVALYFCASRREQLSGIRSNQAALITLGAAPFTIVG